ncbi:hypothetical protein GCM10009809_25280 [Isoptericola hypogeus]|uniref:Zn-dependent metalloprotease n=1 Tax=Isoptericola hypogeus TaxID=300179 RepID=A0ABP4VQ22_9MICO
MPRPLPRLVAATTLTCAVAALTVVAPAHAADPDAPAPTTLSDTELAPQRVTGIDESVPVADPVDAARSYLEDNRATYGIDVADLEVVDAPAGEAPTARGRAAADDAVETVRFGQTVDGVPVFGGQYLVHTRSDGGSTEVLSVNGTYATDLDVDTDAGVTQARAVQEAKAYLRDELAGRAFGAGFEPTAEGATPTVEVQADPQGLVVLPQGDGVLAYQVTVSATDPEDGQPVVKEVMIDADAAWPLMAFDGMQTATSVEGTGVTSSGEEVPLQLTEDAGTYSMVDRSNGDTAISTYDGRGYDVLQVLGQMPASLPVVSGPDDRFDGEDTESGAVDAHVNAGHVYDYYAALGRDGLDGEGGDMTSIVGVTSNFRPFVNAFWDGTKMVYGSGDSEYRTLSADLDVVGHEMTHGVIEHTAGLIYAYQSGAMNEAIADYFGNAVDVDVSGTSMDDPQAGLLGEDLCRTAAPRDCALRDLNDGRTTADIMGATWEYDSGGVHYDSTIFSGALWDIREKLGAAKADRLVYTALSQYMTPTDGFYAGREAVVQAARDLGLSARDRLAVATSFAAHGITLLWEKFPKGDAQRLMDDIQVERTGPAAGGGWWVMSQADAPGEPYSLYAGRTDGSIEPIKIAQGVNSGEREFHVYPQTDGEWVVWVAWGGNARSIMRAPVDGSGEPERIAATGVEPTNLSVDGDLVSWTATHWLFGSKQFYADASVPGSAQQVDNTYHKMSGFGSVQDGKLYYLQQWPDGVTYHQNVVVRDVKTGAETMLPEIMSEDPENSPVPFAGLYAPVVLDDKLVLGVDQYPGGPMGLWTTNLQGTGTKVVVDEQADDAPLLGEFDATDKAITFEDWPGVTVPHIFQVPTSGGKIRPMTCAAGMQYQVAADEGTKALWLDGSYGTTTLAMRAGPRQLCLNGR